MMEIKSAIQNTLHSALEPLPYIHAFWLEGADANGTADAYSDVDFWVDFDDAFEAQAIEAVEHALLNVAELDYRYVVRHGHSKIRQRIYHLEGTSPYLMIDFCWQLHSRDKEEFRYIEGDTVEAVKVIFDKSGVIRYKKYEPLDYAADHRALLEEAKYRYTQHCRVLKYVHRNLYLEACAYYNRYVLEPLVDLLRILHTPAHTDYYLVHISQHIPVAEAERLTYFAKLASLEEITQKVPEAQKWFADLLARVEA